MGTSTKCRIVAPLCTLILGMAAITPGKVIYVDDDATGAGNGSSWANAYCYLQDALAAAQPGDEVRVAQGVYRPSQGASVDPSVPYGHAPSIPAGAEHPGGGGLAFALRSGVIMLGGFAGWRAADPDARDVRQYETVLSGDLYNNDRTGWRPDHPFFESLRTENSLYVVTSVRVDASTVLDGFIIESALQAGMLSDDASPCVNYCIFRKNGGSPSGPGGPGLQCIDGQPSLFRCVFEGNSTSQGGGAVHTSADQLTLLQCRFTDNWTMMEGGAIHSERGDLQVIECTFEKNAAWRGGAVFLSAGTLTLVDCRLEGNLVSTTGGGLSVEAPATASVAGCVFRQNRVGAIYNTGMPLTLSRCAFTGNDGPVLSTWASHYQHDPCCVVVRQCLFAGNRTTGSGAAICGSGATLEISECTFADNWATGGNTLTWMPLPPEENVRRVIMNNCIVWDGPDPFAHGDQGPRPLFTPAPLEEIIVVTHSNVQGGWPGEGNIEVDPLFAMRGHWEDAADAKALVDGSHADAVWVDGDYHLESQAGRWHPSGGSGSWLPDDRTSPCIDAGDPNSPVEDEPEPNGGRVNMGAYGGTAEASKSYRNEP
jgi:hypothetical protein